MSGFRNHGSLGDAMRAGQTFTSHFRKVPSQASTAAGWVDLSMAAGNPPPNYYASSPNEAAVLDGMRGLLHGDDKTPATMHVVDIVLCSQAAAFVGTYYLLDYLLYYPFVDFDDTTPQAMVNGVPLPRCTDGEGVRAMLVNVAPTVGGGSFTYDYTDHLGNPQTSPVIACSTAAQSIAEVATGQPATAAGGALFLPMATSSRGIREITGVTMLSPNGGLGSLVLVKPVLTSTIREVSVPDERSFIHEIPSAPRVLDGAYLGLVVNCAASVAASLLTGRITYAWN